MRNLCYKVTGKFFETTATTYQEAEDAKAMGFNVETILQDDPKPIPRMTEKRRARRATAVKPTV